MLDQDPCAQLTECDHQVGHGKGDREEAQAGMLDNKSVRPRGHRHPHRHQKTYMPAFRARDRGRSVVHGDVRRVNVRRVAELVGDHGAQRPYGPSASEVVSNVALNAGPVDGE